MSKLITYAYFKGETDISQVVDNEKLDNPIKHAGDRLKELITSSFYDELVAQYSTNPQSFSTDNLAFYDPYVKQYLAWQAYEFYIVKANSYETRTGLRIFKEENSDAISDKTHGELIALAKRQTQFYKDRMINFLRSCQRADKTKYPLYTITDKYTTGNGFGISAVTKKDNVSYKISNQVVNQQP